MLRFVFGREVLGSLADPEVAQGSPFVVDSPWPGPGDSDGAIEG